MGRFPPPAFSYVVRPPGFASEPLLEESTVQEIAQADYFVQASFSLMVTLVTNSGRYVFTRILLSECYSQRVTPALRESYVVVTSGRGLLQ